MSRYYWRLHPSSASRWPCSSTEQSVSVASRRAVMSTKFCFNINDDVYIRPKSVKELGISGRIVDISVKATENSCNTSESSNASLQQGKKRRLVEDARVSVQPHCFDNTGHRIKSCGVTKIGIRPSRLFPLYDICIDENSIAQTMVIITPDTMNYRQLATSHLRPSDKVLEIGCSTGECTALIMRRLILLHRHRERLNQINGGGCDNDVSSCIGNIVAFDVGSDVLEQAQIRMESEISNLMSNCEGDIGDNIFSQLVNLQKVDAIADPKGAYAIAMMDRKPEIILIDIGGNRELHGVVRMIHWVQTAFKNDPPRLVIVKSESLVEECSRSYNTQESNQSSLHTNVLPARPNVLENGVIQHAQEWLSSLVLSFANDSDDRKGSSSDDQPTMPVQTVPKYSHPVQAPLALSPKDNVTPICRFHNYHPDGCKRINHDSKKCPYDHEYCHWCKQFGHVAMNCKR